MYVFFKRISRLSARRDISRRFLSSIPPDGGHTWLPSTYVERLKSRHQGLWVSHLINAHWCEKELEFKILTGKKIDTPAMKRDRDRHYEFEKERKVRHYSQMSESQRPSANYKWIEKLTEAVQKINDLSSHLYTSELFIFTSIEGQWLTGKIDELSCNKSLQINLMDLKTRSYSYSIPTEYQVEKDKFQLMLYKHMMDSLVNLNMFPVDSFFAHFSLNRLTLLPEICKKKLQEINMNGASTLEDLVYLYLYEFHKFLMVSDVLTLRYVHLPTKTVIKDCSFEYKPENVLMMYRTCMEMLKCERTATVTKEDDKCRHCKFRSDCPKFAEVVNKPLEERQRLANIAFFILMSQFKSILLELLLSKGFVDITSKVLGDSSEKHPFPLLKSHHHCQEVAKSTNYLSLELRRIFWQGSVFSVEDFVSLENPCFFTCFDVYMVIGNDYTELMDIVDELYLPTFKQINEMFPNELEALRKHHPFETLKFLPKTPRITFEEGIQMLKEVGVEVSEESLETESERKLGQLIREKYNTDVYIVHCFPLVASPFFTTPCENDSPYGNSFAVFLRGKIISRGQHITDETLLKKRIDECYLDPSLQETEQMLSLLCKVDLPHGGFRMKLERMVRLFFGLPHDPHGLAP